MCKNIQAYISRKSQKIERKTHKPIIMRWLQHPRMKPSLKIIDKKVEYLNRNSGGQGKLRQWFLSDDRDFVNITAERYIIDYLKSKNDTLEDNLSNNGIDAVINYGQEKVGIEVTTLNGFFAEWIFTERLMELLDGNHFITDKTLNINYCHERIIEENKNHTIYEYIEDIHNAITTNDISRISHLGISIKIENRDSGCIVWNRSRAEDFPWFKYLTCDLISKLLKEKKKQLKEFPRNIVFVGVDNFAPTNWAIPQIFEEIGRGGPSYVSEINGIESFWSMTLQNHPNISGICYFYYSLDQEEPFYPLRVFWRNESEKNHLNL